MTSEHADIIANAIERFSSLTGGADKSVANLKNQTAIDSLKTEYDDILTKIHSSVTQGKKIVVPLFAEIIPTILESVSEEAGGVILSGLLEKLRNDGIDFGNRRTISAEEADLMLSERIGNVLRSIYGLKLK